MDAMLIERDRKLTEKEAYIVHLQTALSGDQSFTPAPAQVSVWTQHLQHYREDDVNQESTSFVLLSPCAFPTDLRGQRGGAGVAAAGSESDPEGGGVGGALQSAAGAVGEPEGAPGHREGAVHTEGDHVQRERGFKCSVEPFCCCLLFLTCDPVRVCVDPDVQRHHYSEG